MKKVLFVICLIFLYLFSNSSMLMAQTTGYEEQTVVRKNKQTQRNLVCGTRENPIRIAGYMNYPPFGWKEKEFDGNDEVYRYKGIGFMLFDKFAKEYDLVYRHVNMLNFDEAKYALTRNYFDILLNNYYELNKYSNLNYFYPAYYSNPIVIVVLKPKQNEKVPQNWADLKGKKGYVRAEENILDMLSLKKPADVQISKVNGVRRAFQALLKKEVDFLIMSQLSYETEVKRYKIKEFMTYASAPLITPMVFFSYADGNQCAAFIKNEFEKKLAEYTADEKLMRSILNTQLITWENKFLNERSLIHDMNIVIEDVEEKAKDLDAWLDEQKKAGQTVDIKEKKDTEKSTENVKNEN